MLVVEGHGVPMGDHLDSATPAEVNLAEEALARVRVPRVGLGRPREKPERHIADRPYGSDPLRERLRWRDSDLNFNRVVVATEDSQIQEMDISRIMEVQGRHRKKRQRIQRCLPKNLRKQRKLLAKDKGREHRRVEDLLFELSNEFLSLLDGYGPVWEDLSSTTEECLRDAKSRRYRAKLSSWAHGQFQDIMAAKSPYRSRWRYARGTSTFCPFCGCELVHPKGRWRVSRCPGCSCDYDRDRLSSVSVLVRGLTSHRKGEPWALAKDPLAPGVVCLLQEQ